MTPVYPANWKICTPETAFEGGAIPVIPDTKERSDACENCRCMPPGSMFGFFIDEHRIGTKFFRIGGQGKIFRGRLITAPCPRCGMANQAPPSDGGNSKLKYWDN